MPENKINKQNDLNLKNIFELSTFLLAYCEKDGLTFKLDLIIKTNCRLSVQSKVTKVIRDRLALISLNFLQIGAKLIFYRNMEKSNTLVQN